MSPVLCGSVDTGHSVTVNFILLYTLIYTLITDLFFSLPQSNSRNILRIGLHSLGSALWGDDLCCYDSPKNGHSLTTFLYGLRALLRSSLSVAVVTVPSHLMQVRCITSLEFSKTW